MHTPDQIKQTIKHLSELSDDTLVHYLKIVSSKQSKAEKTLYAPLVKAIETERKKRGTASTISSKPLQAKPSTPGGANPDDY
jgi:hypothetical protein